MALFVELSDDRQGAFVLENDVVEWRMSGAARDSVRLVTWPGGVRRERPMEAAGDGHFSFRDDCPERRRRAALRLSFAGRRFRPARSGVALAARRRSSSVRRASIRGRFAWTDQAWTGVRRDDLAIYELHVGTFTPRGNVSTPPSRRLPDLVELGVTAVELMPIAQFPGTRNWGYDGVHPFAVQNSYGGPHGLRAVRRCGASARASALFSTSSTTTSDPEGNYLARFGPYFTDRYHTPWGDAINFDRADSDPVRRFFIDNACQWIRDFHLDGLRLDAVHAIFDLSAQPFLAEIAGRRAADRRGMRTDGRRHRGIESERRSPRAAARRAAASGSTPFGTTTSTTPCIRR